MSLGARGGRIITRADPRKAVIARSVGRRRLNDPAMRRQVVLAAAMKLARQPKIGLAGLDWGSVADQCEVATSAMTARRAFGSLIELRKAVVERGQSEGDSAIIAEAKRFGLLAETGD